MKIYPKIKFDMSSSSSSSSSSSVAARKDSRDLSTIDWLKRGKKCEVCAKKNIPNPVNIYCKTCDKYICHCCLICHQEFTTGHETTQNFYCSKKEGGPAEKVKFIPDTENENKVHGPDFKRQCTRQNTDVCLKEKSDTEEEKNSSQNMSICSGQSSLMEMNKDQIFPELEKLRQWSLSEVTTDTYITGITVTDDGNIFMSDTGNSKVLGYTQEGSLLCQSQIPDPPTDICSVSSTKFVTVSIIKQWIYFLECSSDYKTLTFSGRVSTNNKMYCSICKSGESFLLACDCFTNVDILNFDGELLSSVFTGRYLPPTSNYLHRIYPGLTTDTFWLLDYNSQVILCCSLNGSLLLSQCLQSHHPCRTDDILIDESGLVLGCDIDKIYCMPRKDTFRSLFTFESRLMTDARMCWLPTQNHLVLCLETDEDYMVKIFKKSRVSWINFRKRCRLFVFLIFYMTIPHFDFGMTEFQWFSYAKFNVFL